MTTKLITQARSLFVITGNIEDAETILVNREQLRAALERKGGQQAAPVKAEAPSERRERLKSACAEVFATQPQQAADAGEALTDEARIGWAAWRIKDLEQKLAAALASQPPATAQRVPLTPQQRRRLINEAGDATDGLNQDDFADEIVLRTEAAHGITAARSAEGGDHHG